MIFFYSLLIIRNRLFKNIKVNNNKNLFFVFQLVLKDIIVLE